MWKLGDNDVTSPTTNKDKIVLAVKEITGKGELAYSQSVAEHLNLVDNTNVSRDMNTLADEGRLVHGEKQGRIQPYRLPIVNE
jgi:hypothetical protein